MAASNEAKLIISGDPTGAVKAINDVGKAYSEAASKMGGAFAPLSSGISTFTGAIASLGALLAGGALFKSSIDAANEWNGQVTQVAKAMGTTTEQASVMSVALDHLGISSDVVVKASLAMSRQLGNNEEAFTALGVQTRNLTTGAMLPAGEIMAAVNTKLGGIKNGVEQNIAGMSVYGKAWGELRSILKLTTDEMAKAETRAKALGLIVGPEAAAQTRAYKEAQRDLGLVSQALEVQLGNQLLPTFVRLGAWMADSGTGFVKTFSDGLSGVVFVGQSLFLALQDMGDGLGALAAQAAALLQGNLAAVKAIGEARDEQSAKNTAAYEKLKAEYGKPLELEETTGKKRIRLQSDLQTELARLEKLRAIAAGEADAEIVAEDDKQHKARIKNAEKLRDALREAWKTSLSDAKDAVKSEKELLEKAANTRTTAADKAAEIRSANKTENASQFRIVTAPEAGNDYKSISDSANINALLAQMAAQHGRLGNAEEKAKEAIREADKAQKLADKLTDPEQQASAIERIAEARATAEEAQAAIKKQQAVDLEKTATDQAKLINDLDQKIKDMKGEAAAIVIAADITQALENINSLQAQLNTLQDKTVTVTVNTVQTGSGAAPNSFSSDSSMEGFARGGFTGYGSRFHAAGIVHAGEVVINRDVVQQRGMLQLLLDINRRGLAALPGYASGGLVSNIRSASLRPQAAAASSASAVFNFPDLGRYSVAMADDAMTRLQTQFARLALQKGGRR